MVGASSSSGLRNVRGGVTPRTGFFGAIGTDALSVTSPRKGRSSDGPEFGLAHYFWAGPHKNHDGSTTGLQGYSMKPMYFPILKSATTPLRKFRICINLSK